MNYITCSKNYSILLAIRIATLCQLCKDSFVLIFDLIFWCIFLSYSIMIIQSRKQVNIYPYLCFALHVFESTLASPKSKDKFFLRQHPVMLR